MLSHTEDANFTLGDLQKSVGKTYAYLQTDRQTQLTCNTSIWGSLPLTPIKASYILSKCWIPPIWLVLCETRWYLFYLSHYFHKSHFIDCLLLHSLPADVDRTIQYTQLEHNYAGTI